MAYRASTVSAADAFLRVNSLVLAVRNNLQSARPLLVQASVPATNVIAVAQLVGNILPQLDALTPTPGLAQYAKDQFNDQAYDVVAEYNAMRQAMVNLRDNVISTFPKDGSGFLLYQTINADGTLSVRTFTTAQVATVVSLLDSVLASIV